MKDVKNPDAVIAGTRKRSPAGPDGEESDADMLASMIALAAKDGIAKLV